MSVTLVHKILLAALAVFLATVAAASAAPRSVPHGFVGMHWAPELNTVPAAAQDIQWDLMASSGVESVRADFTWSIAQPESGGPIDLARSDALVRRATLRAIEVLPVVYDVPRWARAYRSRRTSPPRDAATYTRYLAALVDRYGSNGSYWRENPTLPKRPLRDWQIWNEPHLRFYWNAPERSRWGHPGGYGRLLRAAYKTVKRHDRRGRVVLAGITQRASEELDEMYERGGIKRYFDVAALQIFPQTVRRSVLATKLFRQTLRRNRDGRKPIYLTELSWPASKGRTGKVRYLPHETKRGMSIKLAQAYGELAQRRRALGLARVYWYTWASSYGRGGSIFKYSGLTALKDGSFVAQPALGAFRRKARQLQGCPKNEQGDCK
jgi:hypothetical protein